MLNSASFQKCLIATSGRGHRNHHPFTRLFQRKVNGGVHDSIAEIGDIVENVQDSHSDSHSGFVASYFVRVMIRVILSRFAAYSAWARHIEANVQNMKPRTPKQDAIQKRLGKKADHDCLCRKV